MSDQNQFLPEQFTTSYLSADQLQLRAKLQPEGDKSAPATAPLPYPDNNPKSTLGVKKPAFHAIPPSSLIHLGMAMMDGKSKYGLMNWRGNKISAFVYYDAAFRHLMDWWDGENFAKDSLCHHLGHCMACCAILLDALETGNLLDDRPTPGVFAEMVERYMREWEARKDAAMLQAAAGVAATLHAEQEPQAGHDEPEHRPDLVTWHPGIPGSAVDSDHPIQG